MDSKDKRLVVVLFSISFAMLFSGYFFVPFVVHIWTYIANLAGEKDMFLAITLFSYFIMFACMGAAIGLILYAYGNRLIRSISQLSKRIINLIIDVTKRSEKS